MKNVKRWEKWWASRMGFSNVDWATPWLRQLATAGLPGADYLFPAFNFKLDRWIARRPTYADLERALHCTLISVCGLSQSEAPTYSCHGFRHLFCIAGRQLHHQGLVSVAGSESLGHWKPGSGMPTKYDNARGVTELKHFLLRKALNRTSGHVSTSEIQVFFLLAP